MRPPDLIIGPPDNPYMLRWVLWRWRGWQLALHKILRSDDERALHDHVGDNLSIILWGHMLEVRDPAWPRVHLGHFPFRFICWRRAELPHRLEVPWGPVWTLWLRGPHRRRWGFHCKQGWRDATVYLANADYDRTGTSTVGRGCD